MTLADWGLVVSCDWVIRGPDGIVVSSDDFGPGRERRDQRAHFLYHRFRDTNAPPLTVERIEVGAQGALHFTMAQGFRLDVVPNGGASDERWREYDRHRRAMLVDEEQWRLMPPEELTEEHFVLSSRGIEER